MPERALFWEFGQPARLIATTYLILKEILCRFQKCLLYSWQVVQFFTIDSFKREGHTSLTTTKDQKILTLGLKCKGSNVYFNYYLTDQSQIWHGQPI